MTLVVTASIPDDVAESNEAGGKDVIKEKVNVTFLNFRESLFFLLEL